MAFGVVGLTVALVAILGDHTLGELVGRARPSGDNPAPSFPSGHVFGGTVLFGFVGFLAVRSGLKRNLLLPLLAISAVILLSVGPARIYEQAHWPSDVAGGYILGALWLLVLVPVYQRFMCLLPQSPIGTESVGAVDDD